VRGEMAGMLIVKIGGAEGIGYEPLVEDIVALAHAGRRMVLVHGGSAETSELQERLGSSPQMVVAPSGHESRFTDDEALEALHTLCRLEGIIPALESAHALAEAMKRAPGMSRDAIILVNLSGRGDKDLGTIMEKLGDEL